jgi:hypothetical protein
MKLSYHNINGSCKFRPSRKEYHRGEVKYKQSPCFSYSLVKKIEFISEGIKIISEVFGLKEVDNKICYITCDDYYKQVYIPIENAKVIEIKE